MGRLSRLLKKIRKNPRIIYLYMNDYHLLNMVSDRLWAKIMWRAKTGTDINLDNPKGFNEKIQWLKLYNHKPEYTMMVDKFLVRDYVKNTIGAKYLIPLLGIYDDANKIDFNSLPNEFVLKCNHNSGEGMCVCRDKHLLNIDEVKADLNRNLKKNYYFAGREWPYKNVQSKIVCEKFMVDHDPSNTTGTLIDYKFYCFNGEPRFLLLGADDISTGKKGGGAISFRDMQWRIPDFYRKDYPSLPMTVKKPSNFDEMVRIAKALSKGIPFVRVDLYNIDNQVYFSELTFSPGGGFGFFYPEEWEYKLGEWLILPKM